MAAEFDLGQDYFITGLYGWMGNRGQTGNNFTISIYEDGGDVPNYSNLLYSNGGTISGTDGQNNWEGYEITYTDPLTGNTGLFLEEGTYWIAYELRSGNYSNLYNGYMPSGVSNPLNNYAANDNGTWSGDDALNLGVQILGSIAEPVPEPATMILFGTGLVSLVGARLRKKKN